MMDQFEVIDLQRDGKYMRLSKDHRLKQGITILFYFHVCRGAHDLKKKKMKLT